MAKIRLFTLLLRAFALTGLGGVLIIGAVTWPAREQIHMNRASAPLIALGRSLAPQLAPLMADGDRDAIARLCASLARDAGSRLTVIDLYGQVLFDSRSLPLALQAGHLPEMRAALEGSIGVDQRLDYHSRRTLVLVALPIASGRETLGALRLVEAEDMARGASRHTWWMLLVSLAVMALLAFLAALVVTGRIARPVKDLQTLVERYGHGALDQKATMPAIAELRDLAGALHGMGAQLDRRIRTEALERMQEEAILGSMVEGVLAVDRHERVLRMNQAAGRLLEAQPDLARGRALQEVVRNTDLLRFVSDALACRIICSGEVTVQGDPEIHLQAHGVPLTSDEGGFLGVALVLHDVTRLLRLEKVRRDFVANVSHELRTPITAIKGFIETLQDGALDDEAETRRFLAIIHKHADRLHAIIEDLLGLSRLDQEGLRLDPDLSVLSLSDIVQSALQMCAARIAEKGIQVRLDASSPAPVRAHDQLLEQAVVNLIDNAVKFSEPGGEVEISVVCGEGEASLTVRDHGCGIPHEHQGRLFERFYRVDKARSRRLGGTGLGLAIVKHIVQVHGGRITLDSRVGVGSAFTIYLPMA